MSLHTNQVKSEDSSRMQIPKKKKKKKVECSISAVFFLLVLGELEVKLQEIQIFAKFMCMLPSYYPSEVKYLTPMRGNLKFLI